MSSWIDTAGSYPWPEPLARDLHKRLVNTFYEPTEVRNLVQRANAPEWTKVTWQGSPSQVWVSVLDLAGREGSVRDLVQFIVDEERVAKPLGAFLHALLADQRPAANPGAGVAADADGLAEITKEEAFLFGDDLSESVGDIPGLLAAVERVMQCSRVVCRLLVTGANGKMYAGTGTLFTGGRVLTNHHVLFPGAQPCSAVAVEFNYEKDAAGQSVASVVAQGDVASIRSDPVDDWAVITVPPPAGITPMDLASAIASPVAAERAFILQHPAGDPKRLAFVRNRITSVADRRVYYLTDTNGGSSGSPVFDARGKLIALHRAGGDPQKIPGVDPVKKNEGVRLDVIAAAVAGP